MPRHASDLIAFLIILISFDPALGFKKRRWDTNPTGLTVLNAALHQHNEGILVRRFSVDFFQCFTKPHAAAALYSDDIPGGFENLPAFFFSGKVRRSGSIFYC